MGAPVTGADRDGATRVLLLESDVRLRRAYALHLRREGHHVDAVPNLAEARQALNRAHYHCAVLERFVPDGDALVLLEERARQLAGTSILVVASGEDADQRLVGLEAGADDYMVRPDRIEELVLRVENLLARETPAFRGPIDLGRVVVDRIRREVTLDGRTVRLTPHQYGVFEYLVVHRDRMVPIEELLDHCWDQNRELFANPVHTHISRLRQVFAGALRFKAMRGAGYVLEVVGRGPRRTAEPGDGPVT